MTPETPKRSPSLFGSTSPKQGPSLFGGNGRRKSIVMTPPEIAVFDNNKLMYPAFNHVVKLLKKNCTFFPSIVDFWFKCVASEKCTYKLFILNYSSCANILDTILNISKKRNPDANFLLYDWGAIPEKYTSDDLPNVSILEKLDEEHIKSAMMEQ